MDSCVKHRYDKSLHLTILYLYFAYSQHRKATVLIFLCKYFNVNIQFALYLKE